MAHPAYNSETFYSWAEFRQTDATTGHFYTYVPHAAPQRYEPYHYLEIPLAFQEHQNSFQGTLPHPVTNARLGPLGNEGATWPVLATYTPYPHLQKQ